MADGVARVAGAGYWVQDKDGTSYYLAGPVSTEADLEGYMLSRRKNVVDAVLPEYRRLYEKTDERGNPDLLARQMAEALLAKAMNELRKNPNERRIPPEDQLAFLATEDGFAYLWWLQLNAGAKEQGRPPVTMEKAREIMLLEIEAGKKLGQENRARELSQQVSGTDLLGNSNTPLDGRNSSGDSILTPSPTTNGVTPTGSLRTVSGVPSRGPASSVASPANMAGMPASCGG